MSQLTAAPQTEKLTSTGQLPFLLPRLEGVVRAARETDLLGLEWHGGADLRGFYRQLWEDHEREVVSMLVADLNAFPIGLVVIYWSGKSTLPFVPDLQSLRVMPAFRGLGIGSVLIQAVEELVRSQGHAQLSLSVGVDNPRARRLYERREYSVTGEPYRFSWSYQDAQGQTVRVEETVLDMVKNLKGEEE